MYTYVPRDDELGSSGGSLQIWVRKLEGREPGHGPWLRHFRFVAKNWWLEVWQIFGKTENTKLSVVCHVLSIFLVFVRRLEALVALVVSDFCKYILYYIFVYVIAV